MTTFINRNKPEKVYKKATFFTHVLNEQFKAVVENTEVLLSDFDTIEYLYTGSFGDIFACIDKDGINSIWIGKKGDEFED